ncbi:tetratricopeptide repeat protein, partial [Candidatus Venteria ishoeyi]|uniref:tetratricopeptide repeat protein n=1 Tax=Candidatus Venteria ishoeyi TaxID=1899563 RepID=UPI0025A5C09F
MQGLDIHGEAEWQRLKTHLAWSEGFLLGFIFSAHPQVLEIFRERLSQIYRARITRLQEWQVAEPGRMADFIPRLLHPGQREQALKDSPIWLDLSRLDSAEETDWREARHKFLAHLNEQREPLRQCQQRPLILILPASERAEIKMLAPDLWAIRSFCLDTENWLQTLVEPAAPNNTPQGKFPLSEHEQQLLNEWERLSRQQRISWWQKLSKTAPPPSKDRLYAGFSAFNALYNKRYLQEAADVATACLELARQNPEALRDLSVSLDNVGKTAQRQGREEDARAAFEESLDIRRQILARIGEIPEALRDLSVSLNNVG